MLGTYELRTANYNCELPTYELVTKELCLLITRQKVRYAETDQMGIVYSAH